MENIEKRLALIEQRLTQLEGSAVKIEFAKPEDIVDQLTPAEQNALLWPNERNV